MKKKQENLPVTRREWCQYFGLRFSKTRGALLVALGASSAPQSVPELLRLFAKRKLYPNKTTLYRELEQLVAKDIVHKVQLSETRISYELSFEHHHHFVCEECEQVTEISFCESVMKKIESVLQEEGKYVYRHNFELFGRCERCR